MRHEQTPGLSIVATREHTGPSAQRLVLTPYLTDSLTRARRRHAGPGRRGEQKAHGSDLSGAVQVRELLQARAAALVQHCRQHVRRTPLLKLQHACNTANLLVLIRRTLSVCTTNMTGICSAGALGAYMNANSAMDQKKLATHQACRVM